MQDEGGQKERDDRLHGEAQPVTDDVAREDAEHRKRIAEGDLPLSRKYVNLFGVDRDGRPKKTSANCTRQREKGNAFTNCELCDIQAIETHGGGRADWLSDWIFCRRKAYLFEERLCANVAESAGEIPGSGRCEFREVAPDQLPQCAALAELPPAEIERRYGCGDRCFGVFAAGRLVNVNWLHFGSCYVLGLGLLLDFDRTACYLYGVFTDPAYRGRSIYRLALAEIAVRLSSRGVNRIVQVVEEANDAPLHTLPKLGYQLGGVIHHTTVFHVKMTSVLGTDGQKVLSQARCRRPPDVFWI